MLTDPAATIYKYGFFLTFYLFSGIFFDRFLAQNLHKYTDAYFINAVVTVL